MVTSLLAMLGRRYGIHILYDWGDGVGMAYTTAFNFMVAGAALMYLGLANYRTNHE